MQEVLRTPAALPRCLQFLPIWSFVAVVVLTHVAAADDAETARLLRAAVQENVDAANAEDIERSMATFHDNAPARDKSREFLSQLFRDYDLQYELQNFTYLGDDGTYACARVQHSTIKSAGPAFRDNSLDAIWIFRKSDDTWKIWTQSNLALEFVGDSLPDS